MDARMGRERGLPPSRCAIAVSRTLQVPGLPAGDSAHIQVAMTHTASGDAQSQPTGLTHPCICPLSRPYHSHRNRRKAVLTLLRSERLSPSQQGRPAISGPVRRPIDRSNATPMQGRLPPARRSAAHFSPEVQAAPARQCPAGGAGRPGTSLRAPTPSARTRRWRAAAAGFCRTDRTNAHAGLVDSDKRFLIPINGWVRSSLATGLDSVYVAPGPEDDNAWRRGGSRTVKLYGCPARPARPENRSSSPAGPRL